MKSACYKLVTLARLSCLASIASTPSILGCAGCHIPSGKLCKAAISLIRDGVVKPVALEDGRTALQLAAPLLEQELQGRVLASWQGKAYEDLTDPPLEGGRCLPFHEEIVSSLLQLVKHAQSLRQGLLCKRQLHMPSLQDGNYSCL